jgi:UDP-N-acetylmuramoyl-L-alanyl-D-glutamate--2,6-diaminopimelate ligase
LEVIPTVLVDYAHKPDALEKVLRNLKALKPKSLITVVGCGGDRDRTKRPVMSKIACNYSDLVIITSDNPRSEDPLSIIKEMEAGCRGFSHYHIEPDRKKAIQLALKNRHPGDLILIAGKGHETYQIIGQQTFPFDDRQIARECLTQDFKI